MSEVTFNNQSLTTDAVNYTDSVDKLKQAAKSHTDSSGVITITRETTAEDAKKIENYTSQINALVAGGKPEDIQQALWANPILGNKLANLLGCKPHELPTVLSDLNKSVTNLPSILGSLLVSSEDKKFQETVNTAFSAMEPFMKAVTDSDMRELMKLLIAVFAQLLTSQRQNDLLNLNIMMASFESKIADMEKSKDEQYEASWTQAVVGIVMGAASLTMTFIGTAMQTRAAYNGMENGTKIETDPQFIKGGATSQSSQFVNSIGNAIGTWCAAEDQQEAKEMDIKAEAEAMVMEVIRKAQEQNQSTAKAIMDFINNLLSMIQQLNQNARQTEMQIAA